MSNLIKHIIKDSSEYNKDTYKDYIYFAEDKKKIILNGVEYSLDLTSEDVNALESIVPKENSLHLISTNGKTKDIDLEGAFEWEEIEVVNIDEFEKGGIIIRTHPIRGFSFQGISNGKWYSSDGQEGEYGATELTTITFKDKKEYVIKFVNEGEDGNNGLNSITDNSVKVALMIGGSNGETYGVKPVNKNENAKLILYNNITSIISYAFDGCYGFTGDLVIPENVTTIGRGAFYGCDGFTGELIIPKGVTIIERQAFNRCSGFTGELKLPENLTSIGDYAFQNCSGFSGDLIIPEGVTSIGSMTFYYCSGFTGDLIIPDSVTFIGDSAFARCSGLSKIYVCEDTKLSESWNNNTQAEVIKYKKGETPWLNE